MQSSGGIFKYGGMGSMIGFDIDAVSKIISLHKFNEDTVLDLVLSVEPEILRVLQDKKEMT